MASHENTNWPTWSGCSSITSVLIPSSKCENRTEQTCPITHMGYPIIASPNVPGSMSLRDSNPGQITFQQWNLTIGEDLVPPFEWTKTSSGMSVL